MSNIYGVRQLLESAYETASTWSLLHFNVKRLKNGGIKRIVSGAAPRILCGPTVAAGVGLVAQHE